MGGAGHPVVELDAADGGDMEFAGGRGLSLEDIADLAAFAADSEAQAGFSLDEVPDEMEASK